MNDSDVKFQEGLVNDERSESVLQLTAMGFEADHAAAALDAVLHARLVRGGRICRA